MPELDWGVRDKRGEWTPDPLPEPGLLFRWPLKPGKIIKWLFAPESFLWPYNLLYAGLAVVSWFFFTPELARAEIFRFDWIAEIYVRNAVLLILVAGGLHLRLYIKKGQCEKLKYTDKWLATQNSKFLFKNQTLDKIFWNLTSGCIIWAAYEAVTLWAYANNFLPYVAWRTNPVHAISRLILGTKRCRWTSSLGVFTMVLRKRNKLCLIGEARPGCAKMLKIPYRMSSMLFFVYRPVL